MSDYLIERIKDSLESFSKSERKVAEVILQDPSAAIESSIARIAGTAGVSDPTVNRFCRTLGCKGFPDFKLRLAQQLATGTSFVNSEVTLNDDTRLYSNKIFDGTQKALEVARNSLSEEQIEEVVSRLSKAQKIEFYGLGGSGPVALDAQHKFFRLQKPVIAHTDMLMQRMSAAVAGEGDAIVFISNTGRTRSLVETARIARDTGATTIALTAPDSPLSDVAEISIHLQTSEDTDIYTPMTSRIAQLTVLDVIATGITLKLGASFEDHLKKIKSSISATRQPG